MYEGNPGMRQEPGKSQKVPREKNEGGVTETTSEITERAGDVLFHLKEWNSYCPVTH